MLFFFSAKLFGDKEKDVYLCSDKLITITFTTLNYVHIQLFIK